MKMYGVVEFKTYSVVLMKRLDRLNEHDLDVVEQMVYDIEVLYDE